MELNKYLVVLLLNVLFSRNTLGKIEVKEYVVSDVDPQAGSNQVNGPPNVCKQYLAHGYRFEHMYPVDTVIFDNTIIEKDGDKLTRFEMRIAIKSARDGIILLSPIANPGASDLVFEIGVGIAANSYTIIRTLKDSSQEVARVSTPGILSTIQYAHFYIKIEHGTLTVGKVGENNIVTYSDIRLGNVKYFGMSTWNNNYGNFLYDCPLTSHHQESNYSSSIWEDIN